MKRVFIALLLVTFLYGEDSGASDDTAHRFMIGLGWNQVFFNLDRNDNLPNGDKAYTTFLSDNGYLAPFLAYNSPESIFHRIEIGAGNILFGYNYVSQYSTFKADKVYLNGSYRSDGVSSIEGDYLYAAALFYVKLQPFLFGKESYWQAGMGPGIGLIRYRGDVVYRNAQMAMIERVSYNGEKLAYSIPLLWELYVNGWKFALQGGVIEGNSGNEKYHLGNLMFSAGYEMGF